MPSTAHYHEFERRSVWPIAAWTAGLIISIAFLALLFALGPAPFGKEPAPPTTSPTVKLIAAGRTGAGVHLGRGLVLTAAHVLEALPEDAAVRVVTSDGREEAATVLWSNKENDIALVQADLPRGVGAADVACRVPRVGEPVRTEGHPLILEFISSWGHVASAPQIGKTRWKVAVYLDLSISPGNSGGPLFDARGDVVGIVVGYLGEPFAANGESYRLPSGISIAVPGSVLCDLLGRA